MAGAEVFVGCRCSAVPPTLDPLFFVAMIDKEIEVSINTTVETVVTLESSVAEPRGPKAVWEPIPPNAPAKSAALPLCKRITMIRKKHTTTCTIVNKTEITTSPV
jgi:hypothetical protein